MKRGLVAGYRAEVVVAVTEDMCPRFHGSPLHPVYSTASLVFHAEQAARRVLEPFLEDHEDGIGTHVSVDHVAPARVGRTVRVVAEAESVAPHKLVCVVTAFEGERVIARGRQTQRIQSKKALKELFERC